MAVIFMLIMTLCTFGRHCKMLIMQYIGEKIKKNKKK